MGHFLKFIFSTFSTTCAKYHPFSLLTTFSTGSFWHAPFFSYSLLVRFRDPVQQLRFEKRVAQFVNQFRQSALDRLASALQNPRRCLVVHSARNTSIQIATRVQNCLLLLSFSSLLLRLRALRCEPGRLRAFCRSPKAAAEKKSPAPVAA